MSRETEAEVSDPRLRPAAAALRSLPMEAPPSLADAVVAQVKPVAQRRMWVTWALILLVVFLVGAYMALFMDAMGQGG